MKKTIFTTALTFIAAMCMLACNRKDKAVSPAADPTAVASSVNTYVLVHGAWQAPYVWQSVKQQLEAKGQKVIVVNLSAHGSDNTSPAAVSIDAYKDNVINAIKDVTGKIILVGHSMGGVVVSAVAEQIPDRIQKLVYLGAFVPANGQSLLDLASKDKQSLLGPSIVPSQDQLTLNVKQENIVSIFCQDASVENQQLVLANYKAEPAIPFTNKAVLTDANFGKVDKYYIHTAQDHAIGMDLQNQMIATAHIQKVYSVNTGHSPFLSNPTDVVNLLLSFNK